MNALKIICGALLLGATLTGIASAQPSPLRNAQIAAHAATAGLLGIAQAGQRLVAVGDHGVIVLSEDSGKTWKQAEKVPFDGLLTAVAFVDERRGWAVGHAGVILATEDGGRTWALQRSDTSVDRPLLAVHFFDPKHGVAVGLWSLVLVTEDGGRTWGERHVGAPHGAPKGDLNLTSLFADRVGGLYATAERGMLLKSGDRGASWRYIETGYTGSFWAGIALDDGSLLVGGLRGALYRSVDGGQSWSAIEIGTKSSITGFSALSDGQVAATGLNGILLSSQDHGRTFTLNARPERTQITGVCLLPDHHTVLLTMAGVSRF